MKQRKKQVLTSAIPQSVVQSTNAQIVAFGFPTLAETIAGSLKEFADRQDDPKVAHLYAAARKQIKAFREFMRKRMIVGRVIPELPTLLHNDWYAGTAKLVEYCEEAGKKVNADWQKNVGRCGYDPDAYMPVKELREKMDPPWDFGMWTKIKTANPWIRFDPNAPVQHPRIHRCDAERLRKGPLAADTFALLDIPGDGLPSIAEDELTDEYLADCAARKALIRKEKRKARNAVE
jgi:hypothetical protein